MPTAVCVGAGVGRDERGEAELLFALLFGCRYAFRLKLDDLVADLNQVINCVKLRLPEKAYSHGSR